MQLALFWVYELRVVRFYKTTKWYFPSRRPTTSKKYGYSSNNCFFLRGVVDSCLTSRMFSSLQFKSSMCCRDLFPMNGMQSSLITPYLVHMLCYFKGLWPSDVICADWLLLCLESKPHNLPHCLTSLMFQCDALFSSDASACSTVKAANTNFGEFLRWKHVCYSSTGMSVLKSISVAQMQYIFEIYILQYNGTLYKQIYLWFGGHLKISILQRHNYVKIHIWTIKKLNECYIVDFEKCCELLKIRLFVSRNHNL